MKNKIALTLTTILLLTSLVGCGGNQYQANNSENDSVSDTPGVSNDTTKSKSESEYKNEEEYLSCIIVDDTSNVAYFNMTVDEFVANYNKAINNSDNSEEVKALMQLKQPIFVSSDDESDNYDVTNPVLATNRSAVNISITTLKGSKNVYSVNILIPDSAGPNTDISEEIILTIVALTTPTNSLSADEVDAMLDSFIANDCAYYKGLFIGYYERDTVRAYRIGSMTEETYNQIS